MFDNIITDIEGNSINLTQWDINRKVVIDISFLNTKIPYNYFVHFSNHSLKEAICVKPVIKAGKLIVDIPNILLMTNITLELSIFATNGDLGKNIETLMIPIKSKKKPCDYVYSDNVEIIYLKDVIKRMDDTYKSINELYNDMNQRISSYISLNTYEEINVDFNI